MSARRSSIGTRLASVNKGELSLCRPFENIDTLSIGLIAVERVMNIIILISQLVIALGIYNVWLLRTNKETAWRGGNAKTMEEEFHTYGLSSQCMRVVGFVKVLMATLLIVGIWYPPCATIGATIMAALMLAAVLMHMKVKDPVVKSVPAASLLLLSLIVAYTNQG